MSLIMKIIIDAPLVKCVCGYVHSLRLLFANCMRHYSLLPAAQTTPVSIAQPYSCQTLITKCKLETFQIMEAKTSLISPECESDMGMS